MLTACVKEELKEDNKTFSEEGKLNIEEVDKKINSKGRIPFTSVDYNKLPMLKGSEESIITLSPDRNTLFIQSRTKSAETDNIIMGSTEEKVNLIKINLSNGQRNVIAKNVSFINSVKWNRPGSCAAFGGGNRLVLYDLSRNSQLFESELENEYVSYFGWSPDGRILYTEHPNLANGSKLSIEDGKIEMAYETDDDLYYKGILDDSYYYATLRNKGYYNKLGSNEIEEYSTVIVDMQGKIVQVLPGGRFRDSYGTSLIQTNKNGFGLYLLEDINKPEQIKEITKEFIYDAKFLYNGCIAYIHKNKSIEKSTFELHITDSNGNETAVYEVSGSSFLLLPNGKTGYISGQNREEVNFSSNNINSLKTNENISKDREDIFASIRGAMNTYYRFDLIGEKDYEGAKKYFVDTAAPEQWAYFDVVTRMNEKEKSGYITDVRYELSVILKDIKIFKDKSGIQRASVKIQVDGSNFSGSGFGTGPSLELIKRDDNWYVTGFSTFPFTKQAENIMNQVKQCVKDIKEGKLFDGQLKDKEVKIGQIQFWQLSDPHFAEDISGANYCKVYLKVMENNQENVYKMVLHKKNQREWEPHSLSKERLNGLF